MHTFIYLHTYSCVYEFRLTRDFSSFLFLGSVHRSVFCLQKKLSSRICFSFFFLPKLTIYSVLSEIPFCYSYYKYSYRSQRRWQVTHWTWEWCFLWEQGIRNEFLILSFRSAITSVRPLGQYCTSHSMAMSPQSSDKMCCLCWLPWMAEQGMAQHRACGEQQLLRGKSQHMETSKEI